MLTRLIIILATIIFVNMQSNSTVHYSYGSFILKVVITSCQEYYIYLRERETIVYSVFMLVNAFPSVQRSSCAILSTINPQTITTTTHTWSVLFAARSLF